MFKIMTSIFNNNSKIFKVLVANTSEPKKHACFPVFVKNE